MVIVAGAIALHCTGVKVSQYGFKNNNYQVFDFVRAQLSNGAKYVLRL